jgi:hypothetical protein
MAFVVMVEWTAQAGRESEVREAILALVEP